MLLNALGVLTPYLISTRITGTKILVLVLVLVIIGGAFVYYRSRARA
jgi:hypothetical protein